MNSARSHIRESRSNVGARGGGDWENAIAMDGPMGPSMATGFNEVPPQLCEPT